MCAEAQKIRIGIIGASGYTGAELIRIFDTHPKVTIAELYAHERAGMFVEDVFPHLGSIFYGCQLESFALDKDLRADFYFVCTPHGHSNKVTPELLKVGKKVVDLSADFRFKDVDAFERTYGVEHGAKEIIEEAVYGMPELFFKEIENARLIANPGCLARATLLALAPIVKAGILKKDSSAIVDVKTGVSGAGRKMREDLAFSEMNEDLRPYNPVTHRHVPEVEEMLKEIAGNDVQVTFVPHLAPYDRGVLASVYIELSEDTDELVLKGLYREFFTASPFVRILTGSELPSVKRVRGSNNVDIAILNGKTLDRAIVFVALDNLVSGASGNAVHCFNIMNEFDQTLGLQSTPLFP